MDQLELSWICALLRSDRQISIHLKLLSIQSEGKCVKYRHSRICLQPIIEWLLRPKKLMILIVFLTFANTTALNWVPGWRFSILKTGCRPLSSLFCVSCCWSLVTPGPLSGCNTVKIWNKKHYILLYIKVCVSDLVQTTSFCIIFWIYFALIMDV